MEYSGGNIHAACLLSRISLHLAVSRHLLFYSKKRCPTKVTFPTKLTVLYLLAVR